MKIFKKQDNRRLIILGGMRDLVVFKPTKILVALFENVTSEQRLVGG